MILLRQHLSHSHSVRNTVNTDKCDGLYSAGWCQGGSRPLDGDTERERGRSRMRGKKRDRKGPYWFRKLSDANVLAVGFGPPTSSQPRAFKGRLPHKDTENALRCPLNRRSRLASNLCFKKNLQDQLMTWRPLCWGEKRMKNLKLKR